MKTGYSNKDKRSTFLQETLALPDKTLWGEADGGRDALEQRLVEQSLAEQSLANAMNTFLRCNRHGVL
jgi:hypothetical protein